MIRNITAPSRAHLRSILIVFFGLLTIWPLSSVVAQETLYSLRVSVHDVQVASPLHNVVGQITGHPAVTSNGYFPWYRSVTPGSYTLSLSKRGYEFNIPNPIVVQDRDVYLEITSRCASGFDYVNGLCITEGDPIPIKPQFECVSQEEDGTLVANFGYFNENSSSIHIPSGIQNTFVGGNGLTLRGALPTQFLPGYHSRQLQVAFSNNTPQFVVYWTLGELNAQYLHTSNQETNLRNRCGVGPFNVAGSLVTGSGSRVTDALVTNGNITSYTGADGAFQIKLPVGQHALYGVKPGYSIFQPLLFENPISISSGLAGVVLRGEFEGAPQQPTQPLVPIAECIEEQPNNPGGFIGYFGYRNDNSFAVDIPFGAGNTYDTSITSSTVRIFLPGRKVRANIVGLRPDVPTATWSLNGSQATLSIDSPRCVQSAPPICNAGPDLQSECDGIETIISLNGSGSSDPEGANLLYNWSTSCSDSSYELPNRSASLLKLKGPGKGKREQCEALLTVSDGYNTASCYAKVSVSACSLSCEDSERDRCGVCRGNSLCLGCTATNTSSIIFQMSAALFELKDNFLQLKAKLKQNSTTFSPNIRSKIRKNLSRISRKVSTQSQGMSSLINTLPTNILQCPTKARCTVKNYSSIGENYRKGMKQLASSHQIIVAALKKSKISTANYKIELKLAKRILRKGIKISKQVPQRGNVCK